MVRNQIANLTFDLSFGHILYVKCPNGSCKPNFDIYVLRALRRYKELLNSMRFDPCNHFLKIQKSTGTLIPKVGAHLGVWGFIPSHSLALSGAWNVTPKLHIWPTPSQALALVVVATLFWPSVGVKPNTWKKWGFGVLRDSRMFRVRHKGPKHLALGSSWCHWKGLEA
jgi:hypothetical protein